jgi:hypothetical protein
MGHREGPGILLVVTVWPYFEPAISSVSGNAIGRFCFRILTLNCDVRSADVDGRTSLSRAVVTQLVTRHPVAEWYDRLLVSVARFAGREVSGN